MNLHKTILTISILAITLFTINTKAQKTIGGGLAYGTEIENIGFDVTGQYFIKDPLAIEVSLTYYLPKDLSEGSSALGNDYKFKWFELNANVNYYFKVNGKVKPYGLGGLNMSFLTVPTIDFSSIFGGGSGVTNTTNSEIGLNIGGGADFDLGKNYMPFAQLKYVLGNADQLQILAGIRFNF